MHAGSSGLEPAPKRCVIPPGLLTRWNGIAPEPAPTRPTRARRTHWSTRMSMFNKVTKTFQWGPHQVTLETGEIARQSSGAVVVNIEDTVVLATVVAAKDAKAGPGLLPADRRLHREDLCRRQDPRQLLQARRPPERARDADLAADRSPDPAAVSGRLLQRGAGRHPCDEPEPGSTGRHRRADRRFRGAGDQRHSVQRADRRGARRLHQRRIRAEPGQDAARRFEARPRRRRHRSGRADGRIRSRPTVGGSHARRRRLRP